MSTILTDISVSIIKIYQATISSFLKITFGSGCRFTPSCSDYTIEALERYGFVKGISLGLKRFSKCHPFGGYGHDPVPLKNK